MKLLCGNNILSTVYQSILEAPPGSFSGFVQTRQGSESNPPPTSTTREGWPNDRRYTVPSAHIVLL